MRKSHQNEAAKRSEGSHPTGSNPVTGALNSETRIEVQSPKPLKSAVQLLPYQRRWVEDNSTLKIVVKGRQTGFSFSATLRAVLRCIERRTNWIFLSKGERQSRLLMEKVQEHIQSCGIVSQVHESQFFEGTMIKQLEVRFPNGSVIYGLPANPDTARGYSGNVTLDEFAFHTDAEKIYTALYPITTRGYGLEIISTPNGQQGKFYELAKAAGLADPAAALETLRKIQENPEAAGRNPEGWSPHWCDIYRAMREGLSVNIRRLRSGIDEEAWRQEYCCEFLSGGSQWISPELYQSCISSEATADFRLPIDDSRLGNRQPAIENLYAGWDIARNRDLSVIWLSELVGDITWTRGVIEMRNVSTPEQLRRARALLPMVRRMTIDRSGMGLVIAEQLDHEFPGKVEGIQFTQPTKEALAVYAKRRMEEMKVRIPDEDNIRAAFHSVKKTQNLVGQSRFDTEHDAHFGHADHWWAFCLAEAAAQQPVYHLAGVGGVIGRPELTGLREAVL
jgi:phage FluMu gp28-like protein